MAAALCARQTRGEVCGFALVDGRLECSAAIAATQGVSER
jgi:hypothetical protein